MTCYVNSVLDCQIPEDSLASIPCLRRLQNLIKAESLEIIYPVQGRGAKNHTLSSGTSREAHIGEYPHMGGGGGLEPNLSLIIACKKYIILLKKYSTLSLCNRSHLDK